MINIDNIEAFVNLLRTRLLAELFQPGLVDPRLDAAQIGYPAVAQAFDRATVTALFRAHQQSAAVAVVQLPAPGDGSLHGPLKGGGKKSGGAKPAAAGRGKLKPGSAAAAERGKKAAATRAANKAARGDNTNTLGQPTGMNSGTGQPTRIGGGPQPIAGALDEGNPNPFDAA